MGKRAQSQAQQQKQREAKLLKTRTLADVVGQSLRDNFRGWDSELLDVKKIGGLTLRQRLTADKEKWLKEGGASVTFGATYYIRLKALYKDEQDPAAALEVKDPSLVVSADLMKAMVGVYQSRPDRSLLQSFCQRVNQDLNLKEVCGIMAYFMQLKFMCKKQLPVALDVLRLLERAQVPAKHPDKWSVIRDRVDMCLEVAWSKGSHALNINRYDFAELHFKIMTLVVPEGSLRKVIDAQGNWSICKPEVHDVCSSGRVGTSMFGDVAGELLAGDMALLVQKELQGQAMAGPWTLDTCMTCQQNIIDKCVAMPNVELLPNKRIVTWNYMGAVLSHPVSSLQEEVGFKVMCCWKSAAVAHKQLEPLWLEEPVNSETIFCVQPESNILISFLIEKRAGVRGGEGGGGAEVFYPNRSSCAPASTPTGRIARASLTRWPPGLRSPGVRSLES